MAVHVVDVLEMVEIAEQNSDLATSFPQPSQGQIQPLAQATAIRQSGDGAFAHQIGEQQLLLLQFPIEAIAVLTLLFDPLGRGLQLLIGDAGADIADTEDHRGGHFGFHRPPFNLTGFQWLALQQHRGGSSNLGDAGEHGFGQHRITLMIQG